MLLLKSLHVTCVIISFLLFFLRGIWLLNDSPIMRQRWVKIAPHSVDTLLLLSAITLAWQLGYTPFNSPWLAAKVIVLLFYIGLGMVAFRFAKTRTMRVAAWLCAQIAFFYIIAAALTHDPLLSL